MRLTSYKVCHKCLMRACCSQVCAPYKRAIKKKYNLAILIKKISLDKAEKVIIEYLMLKKTHKELSPAVYVKMHANGVPYIQASYQPEIAAERIFIRMVV